jgi:hypothetical protein
MKFNLVQVVRETKMYYLIHDPLRSLLYSLESLGHDVIVQKDNLVMNRVNIISLGLRYSLEEINKIIDSKVPYIVYQTEVFTKQGLNYQEGLLESDCLVRQERYLKLCRNAIMVWECFDFNQKFLKEIGIESQIIYHGYHPKLDGLPKKKELDIDLCFFGSLTSYRIRILQKLRKKRFSVAVLQFEPPLFRDEVLRRTKINLSIRANDTTMSHLPHFRVLTGLYFDTMTVSEHGRGQDWMKDMMHMVDADIFVESVSAALSSKEYEEKGLLYKKEFMRHPMTDFMEPLIPDLKGRFS